MPSTDYSAVTVDSDAISNPSMATRDAERNTLSITALPDLVDRDGDRSTLTLDTGSTMPLSGTRLADRNYTKQATVSVTYYLMRAIDPDCGTLTYRTWVVTSDPDTTGAQYTGTRCGSSALTDVTIVATWSS